MQSQHFCILYVSVFICLMPLLGEALLPDSEVQALREIAGSLGKTNWDFSVDPCSGASEWVTPNPAEGEENAVICNCTYENNTVCHVVSIVLMAQSLPGILPPEAAKLAFLAELDLTRNYLNGSIPKEWGSLPLVSLLLMGNRISGRMPIELTNITTLQSFTVESNQLSGPLPPEIGNLINIQTIVISSNNFSGPLPESLAKLSNLKDFRISDNTFSGKIPSFIQNWTMLTRLEIQASGLQGPIPSEISFLTKLTDLRISDLNGTNVDFPPLSSMTNMTTLVLRNCNISGELPAYIGDMSFLKTLDLSFNNLGGQIPMNFEKLIDADFIYLTGNTLTGAVPEWMFMQTAGRIDLSYNNFTFRSTGEPYCQQQHINLFGTSSQPNNLAEVVPCLKTFRCPRNISSFSINCGGREFSPDGATDNEDDVDTGGIEVFTDGSIYEDDVETASASSFYLSRYNWVFSSTGHFLDTDNDEDSYIATNTTLLTMEYPKLYMNARLSPLSLTYYGHCLQNGSYTVKLHFAEMMFANDKLYSILGRRIFDVYIQGKLVLKDFNIAKEAGGVAKEVIKVFNTFVTGSTLEIRFYWAGKGTTGIPFRGIYGPLVSAISVESDSELPVDDEEKISHRLVIVIILIVVCAILVILGVLWWKGCIWQRNENNQDLWGLDLHTCIFTLRQIKAATNNFDLANKIGKGGFGSVFKGLLVDGTIVAVKQLSSRSKQGNREFVNEIGMISSLHHPNLVRLHGCCSEGNQLLLVYEYLENNSLASALFNEDETQLKLDWATRHKICVDVAKALAYLHEESRLKIVHRDIKATNILLDKDINAKVSDFGLAKLNDDENTHISTRIAGTFGYMAPEYAMRGHLTDKADIYSFGVVALETVSGKSNTSYRPKEECIHLLDWALVLQENGDLMDLVDQRLVSNYVKSQVLTMINVALLCTNVSPTLRPKMTSVVSMLEGKTSVVKNSCTKSEDMKTEAVRKYYQQHHEQSMAYTQTQSFSTDEPWTGSWTSTSDLYSVNPDSQYGKIERGRVDE